jgi:hypothetical protein
MKRYDIIIILIIMVISFTSWIIYQSFMTNQIAKAEIYYQSRLVKTVDLKLGVEKYFSIDENKNVLFHLFSDGSICFEESNCPNKLCVKTGRISKPGQFAACIPNHILLKIVPADDGDRDVDMIIRD